jgi:hypothetical protein
MIALHFARAISTSRSTSRRRAVTINNCDPATVSPVDDDNIAEGDEIGDVGVFDP